MIGRAARSKVRLVLVHRVQPVQLGVEAARFHASMDLAARRSERRYLRGIASRLRDPAGPRVVSALLAGPVGDTLTHYVRDSRADLVVMSTHGRGPLQRAWLGSVADHLIRNLAVPVLLVRPREGDSVSPSAPDVRQIMVPLDGSPLAEAAMAPAAALTRLLRAELVLVQVIAPLIADTVTLGPRSMSYYEEIIAIRRSEAHDYLQSVAERLEQQGLRARIAVTFGAGVAEVIHELARKNRSDLIALATSGHGGIRRLALGSIADKLVRTAETPVLVIRPST
jgi:nucleotide-binding universal stress UspA family protein